jgi:hypothetical protein
MQVLLKKIIDFDNKIKRGSLDPHGKLRRGLAGDLGGD